METPFGKDSTAMQVPGLFSDKGSLESTITHQQLQGAPLHQHQQQLWRQQLQQQQQQHPKNDASEGSSIGGAAIDGPEEDSDFGSDAEEEQAEHLQRTGRSRAGRRCTQGGSRKKVGRPIAYQGDPDNPNLSEAERRRIKRRIANRESARRVQQRRKAAVDDLQRQLGSTQEVNQRLQRQLAALEGERQGMAGQLADAQRSCQRFAAERAALLQEVAQLKAHLTGGPGRKAFDILPATPSSLPPEEPLSTTAVATSQPSVRIILSSSTANAPGGLQNIKTPDVSTHACQKPVPLFVEEGQSSRVPAAGRSNPFATASMDLNLPPTGSNFSAVDMLRLSSSCLLPELPVPGTSGTDDFMLC